MHTALGQLRRRHRSSSWHGGCVASSRKVNGDLPAIGSRTTDGAAEPPEHHAAASQDVWRDHPEKVLGTTADFVKQHPNTCRAVLMAMLDASRWIDASLPNRQKMAETIADKAYVNTSVNVINERILGRYQNGLGRTWDDPNHMKSSTMAR